MGDCVFKTADVDLSKVGKKPYFVTMMYYAVSKGHPLITSGYGPCMALVVHLPAHNWGGLAHLGGYGQTGAGRSNIGLLLVEQISQMLAALGIADAKKVDLQVYLLSGYTFEDKHSTTGVLNPLKHNLPRATITDLRGAAQHKEVTYYDPSGASLSYGDGRADAKHFHNPTMGNSSGSPPAGVAVGKQVEPYDASVVARQKATVEDDDKDFFANLERQMGMSAAAPASAASASSASASASAAAVIRLEPDTKDDVQPKGKRVRPRWVPDSERTHCAGCKTAIGWGSRHHCRRCGDLFCGACTTGRADVQLPATKPGVADQQIALKARVCKACVAS